MIRKINILLAVAFAALFVLKGLKNLSASRAVAKADAEREAASAASALAPHVYYFDWPSFSVENRVANRNGVLLDTLRAIFPKATFAHLRGDVPAFAKALREDPAAVVVGFGHHRDLHGAGTVSEIPIAYSRLAVMTSRSNPWRYKGPESLAGLRIVSIEDFLDFPLVQRLMKVQESGESKDLPTVKIVSEARSCDDLAKVVESGEADAFFVTSDNAALVAEQSSATLFQRFRVSDEIDRGGVLLRVSNLDPAFAKAVLAEYESGMRKIDANGVRRRIFDYYGFVPEPVSPQQDR